MTVNTSQFFVNVKKLQVLAFVIVLVLVDIRSTPIYFSLGFDSLTTNRCHQRMKFVHPAIVISSSSFPLKIIRKTRTRFWNSVKHIIHEKSKTKFVSTYCLSDFNVMDSCNDQKQSALSKEELRRLQFGILQPRNIIFNATYDDVINDQNSHKSQDKEQLKPKWLSRVENSNAGFINNDNGETNDGEVKVLSTIAKKRVRSENISLLDCRSDSEDEGGCNDKAVRPVTDLDVAPSTPPSQSHLIGLMNDSPKWKSYLYRSIDTSLEASRSQSVDGRSKPWNFKAATWNVWFGPQGDGNPHPAIRMRSIVRLLIEQSSDDCPLLFIGFQEVIDKLAVSLLPALDVAGYRVYRQPGASYGCAVAVDKRLEIVDHSWHPYSNTIMQRGFYQVRAKLPNGLNPCPEIVFTTTHLESWTGPTSTGAAERIPQLQEMERFCNQAISTKNVKKKETFASVAIMTGDMNWDDESSNSIDPTMDTVLRESDGWQDVWPAILSKDVSKIKSAEASMGYTYDAKLNPMLSGNLRRRFDRCLVRSSLDTKTATNNVVLLGQNPIPVITWDKLNPYKRSYKITPTAPSDHFGLVAELEVSKP